MAKIFSPAYNTYFDLDFCPPSAEEPFGVISHKSLSDLCDITLRGKFKTDFVVIKSEVNHAVVKVKVEEIESGFTVFEIGEKKADKNDNEIGKTFPVTSAYTRAFDRAFIRILGLEGKFYSDEELNRSVKVLKPEVAEDAILATENETFEEAEVYDPSENVTAVSDEVIDPSADVVGSAMEFVSEAELDTSESAVSEKDYTAFTFKTGLNKGKTIAAVYEFSGQKNLDMQLGFGSIEPNETKDAILAFYIYVISNSVFV